MLRINEIIRIQIDSQNERRPYEWKKYIKKKKRKAWKKAYRLVASYAYSSRLQHLAGQVWFCDFFLTTNFTHM